MHMNEAQDKVELHDPSSANAARMRGEIGHEVDYNDH